MAKTKAEKEEEQRKQQVKNFGLNAFMGILTGGKKGIKMREANYLRDKKVSYFRGKDFLKYIRDNGKMLQKKCPKMVEKVFENEYPPQEEELDDKDKEKLEQKVKKLANLMLDLDLIEKTENDDLNPETSNNRPTKLKPTNSGAFQPTNATFYAITWEGSKTFQHVMMALVIVGTLCVTMYNAWPIWAKVGSWYCAVSLIGAFSLLLVVRLFAYVALWCIGIEFWIFPNLDDADLGLLDGFKPVYSFERRRDGWFMLTLRLTAICITATSSYQIAQSYSFHDGAEVIGNMLIDMQDWSFKKMTETPQIAASNVPSIEDFHKMEEDEEDSGDTQEENDADDDDMLDQAAKADVQEEL